MGRIQLRPLGYYEAESEFAIEYSERADNTHLLRNYGFVIPFNKFDTYRISFENKFPEFNAFQRALCGVYGCLSDAASIE